MSRWACRSHMARQLQRRRARFDWSRSRLQPSDQYRLGLSVCGQVDNQASLCIWLQPFESHMLSSCMQLKCFWLQPTYTHPKAVQIAAGAIPRKRPIAQPVEPPEPDIRSHGCIHCFQKILEVVWFCSLLSIDNIAWLQPTCIHDVTSYLTSIHCACKSLARRSTATCRR